MMRILPIVTVFLLIFGWVDAANEIVLDKPAIRQTEEKLWHTVDPVWQRYCLPIGNGKLGGMVYGGVEQERLNFTIDSLWTGSVVPDQNIEGSHQIMGKVREMVLAGDYQKAQELAHFEVGSADHAAERFGSFSTFGDLLFDTGIPYESVSDYSRKLDLENGLSVVEFTYQGNRYRRTAFASHPDQCMVLRFEASGDAEQNIRLSFASPNPELRVVAEGSDLIVAGALDDNGLPLDARVRVKQAGGRLSLGQDSITVSGASRVEFYLAADTGYDVGLPTRVGGSRAKAVEALIDQASAQDYEALLASHLADYRELFGRVSIDLGASSPERRAMPMDQRLGAYATERRDPDLLETIYQYGRYLLISSSRPGTLPANLQGVWNNARKAMWEGDYHLNINLQMCYWLAGPTNLVELEAPLIDFTESLVEPGRATAQAYFDSKNWMTFLATNIWGHTAPRVGKGKGKLSWKALPTCSVWLSHHLYEHFAYTQDVERLRTELWPVLAEAADFAADLLYQLPNGMYTVTPSWSSEHGIVSKGPTTDIAICREIFDVSLECASILGIDNARTERWQERMNNLLPYQVGQYGQLQEWYEDLDDPHNKHRHINHLWGLHPGTQISPLKTPALAMAARTTLKHRGDHATGWSLAWKLNFWTRLREGDKAFQLLDNLVADKMYPNLFAVHPPFVIDANFGATAGITEMLLQSHEQDEAGRYVLDILPALPSHWREGSVTGLKARGNHEVDLTWEHGQLTHIAVTSLSGNEFALRIDGKVQPDVYQLKPNEQLELSFTARKK